MPRFFICEEIEQTPCVFSFRGYLKLPTTRATGVGRCIRHGELILKEREFPTKKDAQKWARGNDANTR